MQYQLTVGDAPTNTEGDRLYTYKIILGEELAKLKPVIQRRWIRSKIEAEYGAPIKNPNQKRYFYETYFAKTECVGKTPDNLPVWEIVLVRPFLGNQSANPDPFVLPKIPYF
jgi:hypothetical protein